MAKQAVEAAVDELAEDELVLVPGSFAAPERREVQVRFEVAFGDLLTFTLAAIRPNRVAPLPTITSLDGTRVWPDEVLQFMVWVQAKRTNPAALLEDFDHLTLRELNDARARGLTRSRPEPEESAPAAERMNRRAG